MLPTEYKYIMLDDRGVPRIGATRYKVKHLAAEVMFHGWSPYELQWQHPDLTLGQVYSALAYYADHQDELDREIAEDAAAAEQARLAQPADLRQKLVARLKS